jgi:iron-sulfur cluster assembly protein CyaY
MLTEADYEAKAFPELQALIDALDALDLEGVEAELASDILTIEFRDGARYVLNSHRAARQIWLAAERSAWHFDWAPDKGQWIANKTGDELWSTLERILSQKFGGPVSLRA